MTVAGTCALAHRPAIAASVGLGGAFALLVFHGPIYFNRFPGDDAFITFRYAQHLADGLGPNWNSTGHVEGYSSFLWMALLAAVDKLGIDVVDGARVLTYIASFGTMLAVLAVWRLWSRESAGGAVTSPVVPAIVLVALAIVDSVSFWSFSGLETPLYMCLLTVAALLAMREWRRPGLPWSAVAFAAVAMTRPEGIVAAAVTGAFTLDGVQHLATRRAALLRATAWASTFWALYGAYFVWRLTYYGHLFPNTYYAKSETSLAVLERGADYVSGAVLNYHLLPAFGGVALLLLAPGLRKHAAYVGVLSLALLASMITEGGDAFGHGRLVAPLLPLLYLAAIAGYASTMARLPLATMQRGLAATAVLAVFALLLLRGSSTPYLAIDREDQAERKMLGLWLHEHTPQDFTIAAWAVGSIAYHSERDVIDLFGLTDEEIAHSSVPNFGKGIAGHERYNADYVIATVRPEIIVTGDAVPSPLEPDAFWRFYGVKEGLPGKAAVMSDPRLPEMYQVRTVEIDGRWFQFLQRKDTVAQLQAPGLR
ncbi:MAG: hypothetical protein WD939_03270 [Dehalococcoidia bacterium]